MNGVGGNTIAKAQETITYKEFIQWAKYRNRRGSLNIGMRTERSGALIATVLANLHRKKGSEPVSFFKFAPHHDEPVMTLEEAMESWR
ncbi:phage tail assembly protein T [Marinobacter shengliensis]|uniref:phage tail assembly protein T n=1 Tax=Marinobacter shengliensis TaxID=1389223 RepID=UPI0011087A43|nr:hypothetical protein [Marinobacter shengliensis]